jgi:hypothetical protein
MTWRSLLAHLQSRSVSPKVDPSLVGPGISPRPDQADLPSQLEEAVGQVLSSLGIRARVLDRDHLLRMARCLNARAALEKDQGKHQLAEALCQRALDILEKTAPPGHPLFVEVLENNADILHREAALLEARAAAIRAGKPEERISPFRSGGPDWRIQKGQATAFTEDRGAAGQDPPAGGPGE